MEIANIHQAKTHLSKLIEQAMRGEEVIIAKAGVPMVRLMPVEPSPKKPVGGQLKGQIWVSDDFDDFGPELAAMFGIEPDVK